MVSEGWELAQDFGYADSEAQDSLKIHSRWVKLKIHCLEAQDFGHVAQWNGKWGR